MHKFTIEKNREAGTYYFTCSCGTGCLDVATHKLARDLAIAHRRSWIDYEGMVGLPVLFPIEVNGGEGEDIPPEIVSGRVVVQEVDRIRVVDVDDQIHTLMLDREDKEWSFDHGSD